ncbi:helicase-related protein [Cohnella mopanensis]|uniref:helicase-related protein n=1 Tax=Cohnella mopanensis TaxID=2911966 RepID=UPI001EF9A514|nr:helicase-related protein [Cohnella mopanensis]
MKVVLYAVRGETSMMAFFSIAWEVDKEFWNGRAIEMIRLKQPVPLGMADYARKKLNERWDQDASGLGKGGKKGVKAPSNEWIEEFRQIVQRAGDHYLLSGYLDLATERIQWSAYLSNASDLTEVARSIAIQLTGRSLLKEEAYQLFAEGAQKRYASIDPLAAIQYAALNGALQLTAAVAPQPLAAPPLRGFRAWVERLRAALPFGLAAAPRHAQDLACRRCGSGPNKLRRTACAACGQACAYCEACLTMGRSRECELLIIGVPPARASAESKVSRTRSSQAPTRDSLSHKVSSSHPRIANELALRWGLSEAQSAAATQALLFLNTPFHERASHTFLLWAVTGAGKTEMIFPLLEAVLARGGRALVATPRRDVVLELEPRLAKAFPDQERVVLYGGSSERWKTGQLTLATTHQLLRFQEAFDLVLIDELDAFPYHNDPMLHFAADKCRNKTGCTLYLSATPPLPLQRAVAKGNLVSARVPVRYHGHPLPVPGRLVIPSVTQFTGKQRIPAKLLKPLRRSVQRGAQIFLFVPYVKQVEPTVRLLRRYASQLNIEPDSISGTSSKDSERSDRVVAFRKQIIQLLVTTTILERGVTIPKSDVYILDAHNRLFDAASLVQMSGRAGRSAVDPRGFVYYGAPMWTLSQRSSIRQIRGMNSLAKRQGYFKDSL